MVRARTRPRACPRDPKCVLAIQRSCVACKKSRRRVCVCVTGEGGGGGVGGRAPTRRRRLPACLLACSFSCARGHPLRQPSHSYSPPPTLSSHERAPPAPSRAPFIAPRGGGLLASSDDLPPPRAPPPRPSGARASRPRLASCAPKKGAAQQKRTGRARPRFVVCRDSGASCAAARSSERFDPLETTLGTHPPAIRPPPPPLTRPPHRL